MEKDLIGKWEQPEGQPFAGLVFIFDEDGTYSAHYAPMGIDSAGTFTAENGQIDMEQTSHTLGLLGNFAGRYTISAGILTMTLADAGAERPESLETRNKRTYKKIN